MSSSEIFSLIEASLHEILKAKGAGPVRIAPETRLLGGEVPIDSLDLAQLVLELQQRTGKDPFANGFINFESVDDLSRLFRC
jgi:acyl carrier protein